MHQILGTANWEQPHFTVVCLLQWILWPFLLFLLEPYFLSITYAQPLAEVWKNPLSTIDQFAYLHFCWDLFKENKLHDHSLICCSTLSFAFLDFENDYIINLKNLSLRYIFWKLLNKEMFSSSISLVLLFSSK